MGGKAIRYAVRTLGLHGFYGMNRVRRLFDDDSFQVAVTPARNAGVQFNVGYALRTF